MAESSAWIIFISAVFATYIWRFAGVMISHRIEANHPIFEWFTCLAYGIIASLVARTLILPSGVLAEVSLWQRLIPMAFAFCGCIVSRINNTRFYFLFFKMNILLRKN